MDRRTFLAALAAGAVVTSEGLWVPGQKLISIPKKVSIYRLEAKQSFPRIFVGDAVARNGDQFSLARHYEPIFGIVTESNNRQYTVAPIDPNSRLAQPLLR